MKKTIILLVLVASATLARAATEVYLTKQRGDVYSCELDGSNPGTLVTPAGRTAGISVSGEKMYVAFGDSSATMAGVYSYNLDGSGATQMVDASGQYVANSAIAASDNYVYYGYVLTPFNIERCDLDGSNQTTLTNASAAPGALTVLDTALYWISNSRYVYTSNLDGTGATRVFDTNDLGSTSYRAMSSMVTDGNYFYYIMGYDGTLRRRDMTGSLASDTILLTDTTAITSGATSLSLRLLDGVLYWSTGGQKIYAAAADGSDPSATEMFDMHAVFGTSETDTQEVFFDLVSTAPEPATLGLLAMGGLAVLKRKKRKN